MTKSKPKSDSSSAEVALQDLAKQLYGSGGVLTLSCYLIRYSDRMAAAVCHGKDKKTILTHVRGQMELLRSIEKALTKES